MYESFCVSFQCPHLTRVTDVATDSRSACALRIQTYGSGFALDMLLRPSTANDTLPHMIAVERDLLAKGFSVTPWHDLHTCYNDCNVAPEMMNQVNTPLTNLKANCVCKFVALLSWAALLATTRAFQPLPATCPYVEPPRCTAGVVTRELLLPQLHRVSEPAAAPAEQYCYCALVRILFCLQQQLDDFCYFTQPDRCMLQLLGYVSSGCSSFCTVRIAFISQDGCHINVIDQSSSS